MSNLTKAQELEIYHFWCNENATIQQVAANFNLSYNAAESIVNQYDS